MARHALTLEHASRGLALTDGTRRAVRHRVTVGLHAAREIMALHRALETLADRGSGDIDNLPYGKHINLEFTALLKRVSLALAQSKFLGGVAGGDIRLGKMPGQRLGHARWAASTNSDLHRTVT